MKIEVDMQELLRLLKHEAENIRDLRGHNLPMPVEVIDTGNVQEIYTDGWKTGYWQGAGCVIDALRRLVDE